MMKNNSLMRSEPNLTPNVGVSKGVTLPNKNTHLLILIVW